MYWDVVEIKVEQNYTLLIKFMDGTQGKVRFLKEHFRGVFTPLANPQLFANAFIESGAVTWPGNLDIAPDALYKEIKLYGECILR